MKRFLALMFIPVFAVCFAACNKNSKNNSTEENKESSTSSAQQGSESNSSAGESTTFSSISVDFSKAFKGLKRDQKKLVDNLGVTKKNEKIVAYFDNEQETAVMVCTFKNGKLTKAENYRFYKQENVFNAYKKMAELQKKSFTIYDDEKCVMQNETQSYRGKAYDDMLKKLNGYEIKK